MCSIFAILALIVSGFLGYAMVSPQPTISEPEIIPVTAEAPVIPTQSIACATQDVSQDLSEMLGVVDKSVFDPKLWGAQSDVGNARTTTTWRADAYGAVAYLEYLHFDCGVTQEQIDQYFTPETFAVILSSYASQTQTAHCERNGLRLFEFDLSINQTNYHMLYWVEQVTPTRVADIALTFPETQLAKEVEYAGKLFPNLPSCEAAAG